MEEVRKQFAHNVKEYRIALGYSQEKLAHKADVSTQTIKDIESGRRWISDTTLSHLAKALHVCVFELFLTEKDAVKGNNEEIKKLIDLRGKIKAMVDTQFEEILRRV